MEGVPGDVRLGRVRAGPRRRRVTSLKRGDEWEHTDWMGVGGRPYPPRELWGALRPDRVRKAWQPKLAPKARTPVDLYVHVPPEVDPGLLAAPEGAAETYLRCLREEARLLGAGKRTSLRTIYVGSGGPGTLSSLSAGEIDRLLGWLRRDFGTGALRQFTVEVDLALMDEGRAGVLARHGVDRVTGLFGFTEDSPSARRQGREFAEGARRCREAGIPALSLDLSADWPGRDEPFLERNLERLKELSADAVHVPDAWDVPDGAPEWVRRRVREFLDSGPASSPNLQLQDEMRSRVPVLGLGWGAGSRIPRELFYEKAGSCWLYLRALSRGSLPPLVGSRIKTGVPRRLRGGRTRAGRDLAALGSLARAPGSGPDLWIELARLGGRLGKRRAARSHLERAAGLRPDPDAEREIARLLGESGDHGRALDMLVRLAERSPRSWRLWIEAAGQAVAAGEMGAAVDLLTRAEQAEPGADGLRRVAALYGEVKDHRRAMGSFGELAKRFPDEADWWLARAYHAARAGERAAAVESLERSEELKPGAEGLRRAAEVYADLREHRRAKDCLERLTEKFPEEVDLWMERAYHSLRAGERGEAMRSLERAERLGLGPAGLRRAALVYGGLGEDRLAMERLGELVKLLPGESALRLELAHHAARAGERGLAVGALEAAERLKPDPKDMRWAARLYNEMGEHARAGRVMGTLLRSFPDDVELWIEQASAARGSGDAEAAAELLARARASGPSAAQLRRMAMLCQDWGDYPRAIEILDGLANLPRGPKAETLRDKGVCEYLGGRPGEAVSDLEAALRLDPGLLSAYSTLAAVHASQGRQAEALRVYERALRAEPKEGESAIREQLVRSRDEVLAKLRARNEKI